jgi:L-alanine-DL-glutamate epimerase-like enolase superfamily enzyme
VREAIGPEVALRLDANGAWTVDEAIAALGSLASVRSSLCEEPCHGVEALARSATRSTVPVAMDETAREPGALGRERADVVCLRVGALGGTSGCSRRGRRPRGAGSDVYLASSFDGPIGVAAACTPPRRCA